MPLDIHLGILAPGFSMIMITMFVSVVIMVIAAADEAEGQCNGN